MRRILSAITSRGRTTVPKEVLDALGAKGGDTLSWKIGERNVVIVSVRPALYKWQGFIKHGPDAVTAVARARKTRGRI